MGDTYTARLGSLGFGGKWGEEIQVPCPPPSPHCSQVSVKETVEDRQGRRPPHDLSLPRGPEDRTAEGTMGPAYATGGMQPSDNHSELSCLILRTGHFNFVEK